MSLFGSFTDIILNANTTSQLFDRGVTNARIDPQAAIVIARGDQSMAVAIPQFQSPGATVEGTVVTRIVTVKNIGTADVEVSADGAMIDGARSFPLQPGQAATFVGVVERAGAVVSEYTVILG